ncbi:hypothetical protein BDB00DRAFT_810241 [Zychaea mexicana]|uniref:uncharacterized protein n=1 Tax=Zychaea mexicana TaxID=64656 RepID=UPI0022FEFEDE|nr:uncharacterized protein BDB00DRAFT_810241 [Zychaea mexicana]KAI9496077.1 hypothetical protein BDB00DRAFT_810241 [Zychaea mexicana]
MPYSEAQSSVSMDVDQDSADLIKPDQLGPDTDPQVVRTYLEQQVHLKEAYLQSLVTCPDQQAFLATKSNYENWKERLNTMKSLSDKTLDDAKVAHLVPKNLPVFNLRGHTTFAKGKSYDSPEQFFDDFAYVLEAHSINVKNYWKRLMPLTYNATRRAWLVKTMQRHDMN